MIIADVIRGEVRLRTRGRAEVEREREAFDALIEREGLVARLRDDGGRVPMVELETEDDLRLHGRRARLNEPRTRQLACILDLREGDDLLRETAAFGVDWEAGQLAVPLLAPLLAKKRAALALFDELEARLESRLNDRAPSVKSAYIAALREEMASDPRFQDRTWFYAGVEWLARPEHARRVIDAHVFKTPLARIQA